MENPQSVLDVGEGCPEGWEEDHQRVVCSPVRTRSAWRTRPNERKKCQNRGKSSDAACFVSESASGDSDESEEDGDGIFDDAEDGGDADFTSCSITATPEESSVCIRGSPAMTQGVLKVKDDTQSPVLVPYERHPAPFSPAITVLRESNALRPIPPMDPRAKDLDRRVVDTSVKEEVGLDPRGGVLDFVRPEKGASGHVRFPYLRGPEDSQPKTLLKTRCDSLEDINDEQCFVDGHLLNDSVVANVDNSIRNRTSNDVCTKASNSRRLPISNARHEARSVVVPVGSEHISIGNINRDDFSAVSSQNFARYRRPSSDRASEGAIERQRRRSRHK